jgi:hypothetical protein
MNEIEKVATPMMDEAKQELFGSVVETLLPKITPMINPMKLKLENYLNEGKMIILTKPSKDAGAKVLIVKTDSSLSIRGDKHPSGKEFKMNKEDVIGVYDVNEFVQQLLSGNFK